MNERLSEIAKGYRWHQGRAGERRSKDKQDPDGGGESVTERPAREPTMTSFTRSRFPGRTEKKPHRDVTQVIVSPSGRM